MHQLSLHKMFGADHALCILDKKNYGQINEQNKTFSTGKKICSLPQ